MSEALLNGIIKESIMTVIKVAGPFLAAALIIGLIISIIQATTQIQEQTLTFVPKLLGICAIGLFLASWISKTMVQYTENIYIISLLRYLRGINDRFSNYFYCYVYLRKIISIFYSF